MTTVTAPVWLLWVVASLAVCGSWSAVWLAAAGLARVRDWWRDRVTPLLEDCDHEYTPNDDGTYEWCQKCDSVRPTLLELPPERTWEQMTSHQLPVTDPPPLLRLLIDKGSYHWAPYEAARERRAPEWEAEHRAHYVAMGLDYPSGLVARVREAAQ